MDDFQFNTTADGRTLKLLNVTDEFTRECPATSWPAPSTLTVSWPPWIGSGPSGAHRPSCASTTAPAFIANAVADWCCFNGVGTCFIDRGSPWQNASIKSFNGRLRDELLNRWHFDLLEAQVLIKDWRIDYNQHRPHSAHGDPTPNEFVQAWTPDTNQ